MTPEDRQAALDNISPEDLAKIQRAQDKKTKIYPEDLLEAEFALKFGWEAYLFYKSDELTASEMMRLLVASRKLDDLAQYRQAQAAFVGAGSANSEHPSRTFETLTNKLLKSAGADE